MLPNTNPAPTARPKLATRPADVRILCVRDIGDGRFSVELESATKWGELEVDVDIHDEGTQLFVRLSRDAELELWTMRHSDEVAEACIRARGTIGGIYRPVSR